MKMMAKSYIIKKAIINKMGRMKKKILIWMMRMGNLRMIEGQEMVGIYSRRVNFM